MRHLFRRGGGTGRRTGLKILGRVNLREGSSPSLGTNRRTWRNWQTRKIQDLVVITTVGVQVPSSAPFNNACALSSAG